jgi:hypothetical protein
VVCHGINTEKPKELPLPLSKELNTRFCAMRNQEERKKAATRLLKIRAPSCRRVRSFKAS